DANLSLLRRRRSDCVEERQGRPRSAGRVDHEVRREAFRRRRAVVDPNRCNAIAMRRRDDLGCPSARAELDIALRAEPAPAYRLEQWAGHREHVEPEVADRKRIVSRALPDHVATGPDRNRAGVYKVVAKAGE